MLSKLFLPLKIGAYTLEHRVIMAPLTRMRANKENIPNDISIEYYEQRASHGGLIISEATQISPYAQGYPSTPGIYTNKQIESWKKITNAVHKKGGKIFLQLWHVGRASHSSYNPDKSLPVAPSAIAIQNDKVLKADWQSVPFEIPKALEINEIIKVIEDYSVAAKNAMIAGFDGVEIHAANGYLLEQFLHDHSNHRSDIYGGSIENRSRFLLEVTEKIIKIWGPDRVGVRLSPFGTYNDVGDSDPIRLYHYVLDRLQKLKIAYVSMIEARAGQGMEIDTPQAIDQLRPFWPYPLILAGGFNQNTAEKAIQSGRADAIAFGRLFIANPDLPDRLKIGSPLNHYDRSTFYGGDTRGYTDYPFLPTNI